MHFEPRIKENKWIVFFITSGGYFILEKIFNLTEDLLKNIITLKFLALNLVDTIFIILFLIGIGVLIYDKIIMRNKEKKETTVNVYLQKNLRKLPDLLSEAHHIYLVGITLQEIQQTTTSIRNVLRKNGKVSILICGTIKLKTL